MPVGATGEGWASTRAIVPPSMAIVNRPSRPRRRTLNRFMWSLPVASMKTATRFAPAAVRSS